MDRVLSEEMWNWPEFQALLARVGVPHSTPVRSFSLDVTMGHAAEIRVERFVHDRPFRDDGWDVEVPLEVVSNAAP